MRYNSHMALRHYPTRILAATSILSLLALSLCTTVAVYLTWGQSRTAEILSENIDSRQAASGLAEVLIALSFMQRWGGEDFAALHERAGRHLAEIERYANRQRERELVEQIRQRYRLYMAAWQAQGQGEPAEHVRARLDETLAVTRLLIAYNTSQIDASEMAHLDSLRRMSWGLAVVGGLGSVGGLVLGYGLARGLRRSIHRFLIRVQGAADLLGAEPATVEWQRDGEALADGADELLRRIEQAVVRWQRREREVHRAERLAVLGQLAAGVAHEIRNPLTSALLLFQTARSDPTAGGLTDKDLELIEQELTRIERTLQTFLDFARLPQPVRARCDLATVVRDALNLLRGRIEQQGVELHLELHDTGTVLADREQIRQVVLNLLLNALDAMQRGGALQVRLARDATAHQVELSIADSGEGIPHHVLPRLFEPFVTSKETGLGLGLVTCRRIILEHGGTISGRNLPHGGAVFVIRLPQEAES